jgi:hypothetical protein
VEDLPADLCSVGEAQGLLGWSRSKVVRNVGKLSGRKTATGKLVLSRAAVRAERSKILTRLGAVEPDAQAAEIERLNRIIQSLLAGRAADLDALHHYALPGSPDGVSSRRT